MLNSMTHGSMIALATPCAMWKVPPMG